MKTACCGRYVLCRISRQRIQRAAHVDDRLAEPVRGGGAVAFALHPSLLSACRRDRAPAARGIRPVRVITVDERAAGE